MTHTKLHDTNNFFRRFNQTFANNAKQNQFVHIEYFQNRFAEITKQKFA